MSLPRRKRGAVHDRMVTTSMALFEVAENLVITSQSHCVPRESAMVDAVSVLGSNEHATVLLDMLWPE